MSQTRARFRNGIELPNIVVDFEIINLQEATDETLISLRARLEEERSKIAAQLQKYEQKRRTETDDVFAGPADWAKKARFTRDMKGKQIQCIQDEQRRRRIRIGQTIPQAFMDGARAQLDPDTFEALYQTAQDEVKKRKR